MSIILFFAPLLIFIIGTVIVLLLYKTFSSQRIRGVAKQAIGNTYIAIPIASFLFLVFVLLPIMLPDVWGWYMQNTSLFIGTILGILGFILLIWRGGTLCWVIAIIFLLIIGIANYQQLKEDFGKAEKGDIEMSSQPEAEKLPAGAYKCWRIVVKPDEWTTLRLPNDTNVKWDSNAPVQKEFLAGGNRYVYDGGCPDNVTTLYFKSKKEGGIYLRICFYRN